MLNIFVIIPFEVLTMNKIGNGLRKQRENSGYTVKQVIEALERRGISISEKTLYGWESGHRMPDGDMLLTLCEIYATPEILSAFGYSKPANEKDAISEAVDIIGQLSVVDREYIIELAKRIAGISKLSGDQRDLDHQ
jgi:transcriptional regulator with XRE-family HTH domain